MASRPDGVRLPLQGLTVLANRKRLRILRSLVERRRTVSEVSRDVEEPKGTVHDHLQRLLDAGFVERHDDERQWVYYSLTPTGEYLATSKTPRIVVELGLGVVLLGGGLWGLRDTLGLPASRGSPSDAGNDSSLVTGPGTAASTDDAGLLLLLALGLLALVGGAVLVHGLGTWWRERRG